MRQFKDWLQTQGRDNRFCLLVFADPDALASAMALRRFLRGRVELVDIRHINDVTRPDNLAMMRYLRIPAKKWEESMAGDYTHFALLDSQPVHHQALKALKYSLVIDHHPAEDFSEYLEPDAFCTLPKNIGATSTIMTKLMKSMKVRPGPLLATALLYGIRTDTAAFERSGGQEDLIAYHWLFKFANAGLLRRICRSEYLRAWLPLFSRAFRSLKDCRANGAHASLNDVSNADLLVCIADFFTRVHGLRWIAVSGVVEKKVIVIFRGDGTIDMGLMASERFGSLGQGGGHRTLARAEFPLSAIPQNIRPSDFVHQRLQKKP
ncbi:MAG: DHH family phosphoesterase [Desulfovibrio sp.]|nr:DHH family phosphoesterase [Desulfovibrio sp.]